MKGGGRAAAVRHEGCAFIMPFAERKRVPIGGCGKRRARQSP